jgi:hypothetical protein
MSLHIPMTKHALHLQRCCATTHVQACTNMAPVIEAALVTGDSTQAVSRRRSNACASSALRTASTSLTL